MEYLEENEIGNLKKIVADTSAVIEGVIIKLIEKENLNYPEIIIPEAVITELEYQANNERIIGLKGLNHLKELQKLERDGVLSVYFTGKRPSNYDIKLAKNGEIDRIIRDIARSEIATLITSDKIQAEVAEAQGIPVIYIEQKLKKDSELGISKFFDNETMSVHLKENVPPMAKKGIPGNVNLVKLDFKPINYKELEKLADEIIEKAKHDFKTYIELDLEGAVVVQSQKYRIAIAKPPFSEAIEITAVKPVMEVSLEKYKLSEKLLNRLKDTARGILISGSPGAGKSTFAQAVAKFFSEDLNRIVKTMESPRDLQVGDEITQYAPLEGDMEKTADILLLVRPDFTIYDELRKNHDFNIFADMRLAGVGMIGVVHATRPIDAIQRIAGRVELGIIPSIVDTTIYIENGEIKAIYETKLTVKVPSGMQEADLARPVIEVKDFETGDLKNEIYTYGEQTIVIDVNLIQNNSKQDYKKSSVDIIAEKEIIRAIKKIVPKANVKATIISKNRVNIYVDEKFIPKIIGKNGKRITEIEKKIGINIGVEALESLRVEDTHPINVEVSKKYIMLNFGKEVIGSEFDILINNEYLFTATVGKKGNIKLKKGLKLTDMVLDALDENMPINAKLRF